jgi:predicted enzyme related to lactoylglutathione lyase
MALPLVGLSGFIATHFFNIDREIRMPEHEKIDYVEFPAKDIEAAKSFFSTVFDWSFEDYGPDYAAFSNEGINGGFYRSDLTASTQNGSALIVFYSNELESTQ